MHPLPTQKARSDLACRQYLLSTYLQTALCMEQGNITRTHRSGNLIFCRKTCILKFSLYSDLASLKPSSIHSILPAAHHLPFREPFLSNSFASFNISAANFSMNREYSPAYFCE